MQILIGTTNPSKVAYFEELLADVRYAARGRGESAAEGIPATVAEA